MKGKQEVAQTAARGALALLAFSSLSAAVYLGLVDKVAAGTLCGALGLLLLAFVQLSRFKRVKGLGFEAELWEEKQEEAEALIEQTRALLGALASSYMTTAPRLGRLGAHYTRRELYDLAASLEHLLREAGVPASAIEVQGEVRRMIAGDMARAIARPLSDLMAARYKEEAHAIGKTFGSPIRDNAGHNAAWQELRAKQRVKADFTLLAKAPPRDLAGIIRGWVAESELLSDADRGAFLNNHADAFSDLDAWAYDGTVRRPEVFFMEEPDT